MSRSISNLIVYRRLNGVCGDIVFLFLTDASRRAALALVRGESLLADVGPHEGQRYARPSTGRSLKPQRRSQWSVRISPLLEE